MLSPDGDCPIYISINRLVAKGLESKDVNTLLEYPCRIANRFECPYEKGKLSDAKFDVEDLFELANMAFAVARKDTSGLRIKNKQDLYQALTNREIFDKMLEQGIDYVLSDKETFSELARFEQLQKDNIDKIVNYFMNIKDKVRLEELKFY